MNALGLFAFSAGVFVVFGYWQVQLGRKAARQFIRDLDDMKRRFEAEDEPRFKGAISKRQRAYLEKRRADENEWHARECAIQREWLKRPFYRQFGMVPFPAFDRLVHCHFPDPAQVK